MLPIFYKRLYRTWIRYQSKILFCCLVIFPWFVGAVFYGWISLPLFLTDSWVSLQTFFDSDLFGPGAFTYYWRKMTVLVSCYYSESFLPLITFILVFIWDHVWIKAPLWGLFLCILMFAYVFLQLFFFLLEQFLILLFLLLKVFLSSYWPLAVEVLDTYFWALFSESLFFDCFKLACLAFIYTIFKHFCSDRDSVRK